MESGTCLSHQTMHLSLTLIFHDKMFQQYATVRNCHHWLKLALKYGHQFNHLR